MSLGQAILRIRKEKRLTQAEVGKRAHLAVSYVSRIENGRVQPTMRTLGRLAEALDVSVTDVFRLAEDPLPERFHRCPVSHSGECVGELIRSDAGRRPKSGRPSYGTDELRLLRMTDYLVQHGSAELRRTLTVVLEALAARAGWAPPR